MPNIFRFKQERTRAFALIALGVLQCFLYGIVLRLSGRFAYGSPTSAWPIRAVLVLFGAAFILYLLSLALMWNFRSVGAHRKLTATIFGFAAAFRLLLWWSQPIQEVDFYRYLWDGRVTANGINPYLYSPAQIDQASRGSNTSPVLARLVELKNSSPELQTIFSRVHQRDVPTIYPPFSQAVFAAVALMTPANVSVAWQIRILKFILLVYDLATVTLVWLILRQLTMPTGRVIAYAWCPLVLKEFANSAHLDSIVVCLVTLAVWLLIKAHSTGEKSKRVVFDGMAAGAWALAILAKIFPVILAPVFIRVWWMRFRWRGFLFVGLAAAVVASGYLPFLLRSGNNNASPETRASESFKGLQAFASRWEMNDLIFMVVEKNLDENRPSWFTVTPHRWRARIVENATNFFRRFGLNIPRTSAAFVLAQLLMGVSIAAICSWATFRLWPGDSRLKMLESFFLCLAWLWFFSATQNPWYWTWTLPFIVFARSRVWLLVSGFALLYYARFSLQSHFRQTTLMGTPYSGAPFFDYVVVWFEHLPVLLLLVWVAFRKLRPCARVPTAIWHPPACGGE